MKMESPKVEKKDPYVPSAVKRYEVAKDDFSRARIQSLRDTHHALEAEFGVPLSFSIMGSLVKGKLLTPETAQGADIDLMVYFDLEKLNNSDRKRERKISRHSGVGLVKSLLARPTRDQLKNSFKKVLKKSVLTRLESIKSKLGYEKVPDENIWVVGIDNQSIMNALEILEYPMVMHDPNSTTEAERIIRSREMRLATFFTLSIGEPVKKYRNQFLAGLAHDSKKYRDEIWKTIKDVVERIERQGDVPPQIQKQFPQTLEEALKFYGVKTS